MTTIKTFLRRALLAVTLIALGSQALAGATYRVQIDTSALAGQSGWLDFLFLGLADASPAAVTLTDFSGSFDVATQLLAGDATGSLAIGVVLGNAAPWNEFAQWTNFGGLLGVTISLDQPLTAGAGSTLSIALLDQQFGYLGAVGDLLTVELLPGAEPVVTSLSTLASAVPHVASVPEPATVWLLLVALPVVGMWRRKALRGDDQFRRP